jgi:hypothetical protein
VAAALLAWMQAGMGRPNYANFERSEKPREKKCAGRESKPALAAGPALALQAPGRDPVAQGIEQQPSKLKVAGSNPAGVANSKLSVCFFIAFSLLGKFGFGYWAMTVLVAFIA